MSEVFTSFADLAEWAGIKVSGKGKGKKLKKPLPETSFLHVKGLAGRPAAAIWAAINDQESSKRSGLSGSPLMSIDDIVGMTGFDPDDIIDGVMRLARHGLVQIKPNDLIAA